MRKVLEEKVDRPLAYRQVLRDAASKIKYILNQQKLL
jgi:hypothetical protein